MHGESTRIAMNEESVEEYRERQRQALALVRARQAAQAEEERRRAMSPFGGGVAPMSTEDSTPAYERPLMAGTSEMSEDRLIAAYKDAFLKTDESYLMLYLNNAPTGTCGAYTDRVVPEVQAQLPAAKYAIGQKLLEHTRDAEAKGGVIDPPN